MQGSVIITSTMTARCFIYNTAGVPFTASYIQAKGDPIADLYEDIAAEEKAKRRINGLLIFPMILT